MSKLIITTILLLGLASSVSMQQSIPIQQGGQVSDQLRQLPFGGNLMNLPQQIQGSISRLPFMNSLQGTQGGGFLSTLRDLPSRGMQMLGNVFSGFRNMIPGLGRNGNGMNLPNMPNMPDMPSMPNMPSLPNMPSTPNMPNMPNLSNLPMGDRLQQGAQTLSNAVSSLTNGIRGVIPRANGLANGASAAAPSS